MLVMMALAAVLVLVPGLFWWGTWFGKRLDDGALLEHLAESAKPRHVQHGVNEIALRLDEGRPGMDRWVEELVRVSANSETSVRATAAWAMQHGSDRPALRARLVEMVTADPAAIVRRNAAASLSVFGDASGRPVLRAMLSDHTVAAPRAGTVAAVPTLEMPVTEGMLLVRLDLGDGRTAEVRADLPGRVREVLAPEGASVAAGDALVRLSPAAEHVRNAVVALAMVGTDDDLPLLRQIADPRSGGSDDVRVAAAAAVAAIEARRPR